MANKGQSKGNSFHERNLEVPTRSHKNPNPDVDSSHRPDTSDQEQTIIDEENATSNKESYVTESQYASEDEKAYLRLPDMPDIDFEDLNFPPGIYFSFLINNNIIFRLII